MSSPDDDGVRSLVLTETLDVQAAPEQVWRVFQDLEAWPRWNSVCLNANWTDGEPWRTGARFRMVLRMAGVPVPFHVVIDEIEPAHAVAWVSTVASVTGHRRFTFIPIGDTGWTRVDDVKTFTSPVLPLRLFYPRPIIQAMSRGWLRSLKRQAEAESATR